jgi:hypothetical protein
MNARANLTNGRRSKNGGRKVCMYFCVHLYISNLPAAMNSQPRRILFATAHPDIFKISIMISLPN